MPVTHVRSQSCTSRLTRRHLLAGTGAVLIPAPVWVQAQTQAPTLRLQPETFVPGLAGGAAAGAVVELAPGRYDAVELRGPGLPATLRSADPDNPAIFSGFQLLDAAPMTIERIAFDHIHTPGEPMDERPFRFTNCQGLLVRGAHFDGAGVAATSLQGDTRALGWGIGPSFHDCTDLTLAGCRISRFLRGVSMRGCSDVRITNNEVVGMRMDAMSFSMMERLVIENNHIHDFHRSDQHAEHPDMIQFWTENTTRPSRAITIRGNVLSRGAGDLTQTIFMRNELVDTGRAGDEMFYREIVIEENVILNSHLHGITVGETHGLTVRRNTLIQVPHIEGDERLELYIPLIRLNGRSRRVEVTDNITWRIDGFGGQADWRVQGNLLIQRQSLIQPNHYAQVFAGLHGGDPNDPESYIYRADGPAGSGQVGAPRLRP